MSGNFVHRLQATDTVCNTDCDFTCMSAQQHVRYQHVVHRQTLQSDDIISYKNSCFSDMQSVDYTDALRSEHT